MSDVLIADRSDRGKLSIEGPQRAWFLHQILSQSFEDIRAGESRDAAFLTAQGRMKAFMETVATEDALLMHFEPELRQTLPEEIRRYVFATQVTVTDVSDELGLVLVVAASWRDIASDAASVLALHPTSGLGVDAGYLWIRRSDVAAVLELLRRAGARDASEDELEAIRISNGVPRWGREMDTKTFPQEAGIDDRAVHYDKGCYVGQEAMAKIHFRGKVNRRLALLTTPSVVAPGTELMLDDQRIGSVTSAAADAALALVRYTVEPGTELDAGGIPATVAS